MATCRAASERGAILIQVGLAILALTAFSMFVIDYGIMWVSRSQAQNAADAGALAGAIALAFDDPAPKDYSDTGPSKVAAQTFARANNVFGEQPDVNITTDIDFSAVNPGAFPPICNGAGCIRVRVYRNQNRGNPLPMWFGTLVGKNEQGVRAEAIAWAKAGNASKCMRPWAVADKWVENDPVPSPWDPTDEFNPAGPNPDVYRAPTANDPGTGFTVNNDMGTELKLKVGSPHDTINPGWFQAVDLTGGGGSQYEENISGCANRLWKIGDEIPKENGNMVGPTGHGTNDLMDLDPNADWDPVNKKVVHSCVDTNSCVDRSGQPVHYTESPRIVPVPIFDLAHYMATGGPGNGTIRIVNILGFFVDRLEQPQNSVVGYLVTKSDLLVTGGGNITEAAAFVKTIQLVR